MRICFYSETALPKLGGQQVVVDRLARELTALGHPVTLLTQPPRKPLVADDAAFPYPVVRHPRFVSTTHFVSFYQRHLLRLHRQSPFDLLHCHSLYPTAWLAALVRSRLNIPVVITSHGGDVREGGLRLRKPRLHARYVAAVRAADALVAISRFTHDGYLRFDPAAAPRIHDIPNGVDLDTYSTPVPRPPSLPDALQPHRYLLFLGRLTPQKGVDTLLHALPKIRHPQSAIRNGTNPQSAIPLAIAGDGPDLPRLQSLAPPNSHFLGRVDGPAKTWLLQNALCTVVPSREYEAFGLVVLESHAASRPVIASNLPGLADLVPQDTGLLVPPDNPTALATAIRTLLDDPLRATALGQAGRRAAAQYAWPHIAHRHVQLYQQLRTSQPPSP